MSAICRNRTLCVAVSVLNKCIMARNSIADMLIGASDVGGAAGGTGYVAGGSVEVASGIGGAGVGGIDSVRSLSYCACSAYGGTGGAGLGEVPKGAK